MIPSTSPRVPLEASAVEALASTLRGEPILPGNPTYDEVHDVAVFQQGPVNVPRGSRPWVQNRTNERKAWVPVPVCQWSSIP